MPVARFVTRLSIHLLAGGTVLVATGTAHAASLAACSPTPAHSAPVQDRLLQVATLLRQTLQSSGGTVALVARSGQALGAIGHRYSHAALALRHNPQGPWAVRQLYFDCDALRPRVFDQGLSGFVGGTHAPDHGFLHLLLLPPDAQAPLEQAALHDPLALALLGNGYSANAHAWGTTFQNCNQWVAEMMGTAWSQPRLPQPTRQTAQAALRELGYTPSTIAAHWPPIALGAAVLPWFHTRDHPPADVAEGRFVVSMPSAMADWAQRLWPASQSLEVCHTANHAVLRRNGPPLPDSCEPGPHDTVFPLETDTPQASRLTPPSTLFTE
jgi:hypothetical protein